MFDLRYHVASLTAVFLALAIGILVGVGISGRGFVDDAERRQLNAEIARLQASVEEARVRNDELEDRQAAAEEFVEGAYPVLVDDRLAGRDVAVVVVGSPDATLDWVLRALDEADARLLRLRALRAPLRIAEVAAILESQPSLGGYVGDEYLEDVGRDLGREFAAGGTTPLWDALEQEVVIERSGAMTGAADAVVVVRAAPPQGAETARFLAGFYSGTASVGEPVVGVEGSRADDSAIPIFQRHRMSTVDGVDTPVGRLALVLLLGGGARGDYGVRDTADDGILPPIEALPSVTTTGG
ncbi:MAG TPA: copper transporter [Gaiellaceae bacterium]|nr:copper transporter [Gaiellaceae bacterium]